MTSVGSSSFSADLRCPDDGHLLQRNAKGAVGYAMCRHCDGLWFTREAIESKKAATLPERTPQNRRKAAANHIRGCPECSIKLEQEQVDDVVIDVCPQCGGVWLDHGEYKAACRRAMMLRLNERAPGLTRKPSRADVAFERLLDKIIKLHNDLFAEIPDEPMIRLTPRARRRRRPTE